MTRHKPIILYVPVLIMILCSTLLASREKTENRLKLYTVQQLQQDFRILRIALEEGHAGLYRYTPKAELEDHFASIEKNLDRPMTEWTFYKLLAPLIAHIHDGHTRISLSQSLQHTLDTTPDLFPFNLKFIEGRTYLFRNYSEREDIAMGSEILAINGRAVHNIVEDMLSFIPNDAHIQTSKYRKLENTDYFGHLFNLIYGPSESYDLTCIDSSKNDKRTFSVMPIKPEDITAIARRRYPEIYLNRPPIQFEYKNDIAILTVRTFSSGEYQRAKIGFPVFLRNTFQELIEKKTEHLVIDLRDNGGGADAYGKILFAHFIDEPYRFYEHLRTRNIDFSFFEYTKVSPEQQKNFVLGFKKNDEGSFDLRFHFNLGIQKPIPPIYKGKVYVLLNGNSFSGTGECTSLMHFHHVATFIGEECGAGYYGNTSGFMPMLTLPNTQIRVRIPMIRYTMAVSGYPKDRGIIPDYPVQPKIADLLNGRDTVMEYTLALIQNSR